MPRKYNPRSGFQQGHPYYRSRKPGAYAAPRPPGKQHYEKVDSVPDGLRWKPAPWGSKWRPVPAPWGGIFPGDTVRLKDTTTLFSFGNVYRLVRKRDTGEVTYYKLKDVPEATPAEQIDAEPKPEKQVRYRVGTLCWFVDTGDRWFLVEVVERTGGNRETFGEPGRITIRPVNQWDADKKSPWEYGELLEFPTSKDNRLFSRLRPLKARYR